MDHLNRVAPYTCALLPEQIEDLPRLCFVNILFYIAIVGMTLKNPAQLGPFDNSNFAP